MNLQEARTRIPEIANLDDESAISVIQRVYYPEMELSDLASRLGYKPASKNDDKGGFWKDAGITALKSAISVPEAAVGLADLVTMGGAGKLAEEAGFRPKEAKELLSEGYSDRQKAAFKAVQDAEGFTGTMAAALENPSVIAHSVGESIAPMLAGGVVSRGLMGIGSAGVKAAAGGVGPVVPGVMARTFGQSAPLVAGAVGEGVMGAGSAAEQIRQQTQDGYLTGEQAALAGATGVATTAFGLLGGKIAQRLGIGDVDTMLVGAARDPALRKGVVRSFLEGAASEGFLEELPQSVAEQVLQNAALGKPLDEGVDQAAVLGLLSGGAMGGGAGAFGAFGSQPKEHPADIAAKAQADALRAGKQPETGALTKAVNAGTEAQAQAVEAAGASVATADKAMADMERQAQRDLQGLRDFASKDGFVGSASQTATTSTPGAKAQEGTAELVDSPFSDRLLTLKEQLADPANRERVRSRWGDQGLSDILYYAGVSDRTDIPERTQENMLTLAERLMSESLLTPINTSAEVGGGAVRDPLMLGNEAVAAQATPMIGMNQARSGRFTVDAQGNATPETTTQQSDSLRRAQDIESMGQAQTGKRSEVAQPLGSRLSGTPMADMLGGAQDPVSGILSNRRQAVQDMPSGMAPRSRTDGQTLAMPTADPVRDYVDNLRNVNTPAAKFYVSEFDSGRITPADVQQRMSMEQGKTPDQRVADAAAQAPKNTVQPGDILNPSGQPFKTLMSARLAAKKTPSDVIEVVGGYSVRPKEQVSEQQAAAVPTGVQAADTGTAPVAQGPENTSEGSGYAGTPAVAGKPEQKKPLTQDESPFEHVGLKIRTSRVKVGEDVQNRWVVQSPENAEREARGERQIGGDRIVDTREQAIQAAEQESKKYAEDKASKAEMDAREKAEREAAEAKKEANRGKTVVQRRADAILDKPSTVGQGSKREVIESAVRNGRAIVEKMVDDTAAKKRDREAVDRVSRAGYILGLSNENIPVVKAGLEAQARLKTDKYQKPEYRMYSDGREDGPFREISKTEYDYAQSVKSKPAETAPQKPVEAVAPVADSLPDGWTETRNGYTGMPVYRMTQGLGQPFAVVTQTEAGYEVQIRHGDKQLSVENMPGASRAEALDSANGMLAEVSTHKDPGANTEAVTPAVVAESLTKAAKREDVKPADMKKWLVGELDKAMLEAPDRADYDDTVKGFSAKDAEKMWTGNGPYGKDTHRGFLNFDVPGDGKFKVRNGMRGLLEFKQNVERSKGFSNTGARTAAPERNNGVQGGSGGNMSAITNMIDEGDFEAARDFAEAVGIPLADVKVPRGTRKPQWDAFMKDGTVPPQPDTRPQPAPKTAAELDAEKKAAREAEANKPGDTGWNMAGTGYGGKRYIGRNIKLADGREIVARVYENAGVYEEAEVRVDGARKFAVTDRDNAQDKADAYIRTLTAKTSDSTQGTVQDAPQEAIASAFPYTSQDIAGAYIKAESAIRGKTWSPNADSTHKGRIKNRLVDIGLSEKDANAVMDRASTIHANQRGATSGGITFLTARDVIEAAIDRGLVQKPVSKPAIPDGYKPAGEQFYRNGDLVQGYAPFTIGERVTLKDSAGQSGVVESLTSPDENGVFSGAFIQFDNGVSQIVTFNKLDAEKKKPVNVTPQVSGNPERFIKVAADSVRELRAMDVDRVLNETPVQFRGEVAAYIRDKRKDLVDEVDDVMADIRGGKVAAAPVSAPVVDAAPAVEAAAEPAAPKLTQAEAKDLMEWQDLGTKDGVKTHILTFYESKADKDALRGRMTIATITKGDRSANAFTVDGDDQRFGSLAMAKKRAMELGMTKAVADGFVEAGEVTQPKAEAKAAQPASKIDDFGQKIAGAKKDLWTGFSTDLGAVADDDIASHPLSKVWPAPDYQALIDGGADHTVVAFVRAARDEVPAKPRTGYKVKGWATKVKTLRGLAVDLMSGKTTMKDVETMLERSGAMSRSMQGFMGRVELYKAVGHAKSLDGIRMQWQNYTLYKGEKNVSFWVVEKDVSSTSFGNWPTEIAKGKTKEEAIEAFRAAYDKLDSDKEAKKGVQFVIMSERGATGYWIAKKIGRNYAKLEGPFKTVQEARNHRDNNQAALVEKLEKYKEIPVERRDVNEPRVGEDMRGGADVTPQMFGDTFGFKGVQFGNWVEQGRRQQDLNNAFDALMDMAAVLGIPPKAISLNGQLGLAFGARGSGGVSPAAAHYEPDMVVINLTKVNGAGSLGHEWWHAVDNYFAKMRKGAGGTYMTVATDVRLAARDAGFQPYDGVRLEMVKAFGNVVKAINLTGMKKRAAVLDGKRSKEYWTTGEELSARSFEAYLIAKLQDQNASNDYLANIVSEGAWDAAAALGLENENSYPYPTAKEVPGIRAAFDQLFQTVQTKEDDAGNVALYRTPFLSGLRGLPVTHDAVVKAVQSVLKGIPNAPQIEVHRTPADAGLNISGPMPKGGVLPDGRIVVFSDANTGVLDVMRTVFHELFHRGLKSYFATNADYVKFMLDLATAHSVVRKGAADWKQSPDGQDKLAEFSKNGPMTGDRLANYEALAVEESLATMSETLRAGSPLQVRTWTRAAWNMLESLAKFFGMDRFANWIHNLNKTALDDFVNGMIARSGDQPRGGSSIVLRGSDQGSVKFRQSSDTLKETAKAVVDRLGQNFSAPGKISWWDKTVGSMYHMAERYPAFKPVFEAAQNFINDVSYYGTEAANMAPRLLPKLDTWTDLMKSAISAADNEAVAAPVFEGTLVWARDESGNLVKVDDLAAKYDELSTDQKARMLMRKNVISEAQMKAWKASPLDIYEGAIRNRFEESFLKAGVVFTDDELKSQFKLNDDQIALYKEFRAAADISLDNMTKADMLRIAGKDLADMRDEVMEADLDTAAAMVREKLLNLARENPDREDVLTQAASDVLDRAAKAGELKLAGYAPLSRFGKYTVDVVVDGDRKFFSLYETAADANRAAEQMRAEFGDENVEQGTLSQREFELFQGITPESLELFGNMLGLDSTGDEAQDKAFQDYLRLTKSNRSALKRLIHRKGIEGYSEDVGRVLASFVYSNARQTAAALHIGDMGEAIAAIPKGDGELKDAAIELGKYVKEPREEAHALRGLLFAQYLGGSVASALINFSQPLAVSIPYLSQFGGISKAALAWRRAVSDMAKGVELEPGLAKAMKKAEEKGVVSPQEVHQLMAQARGTASLRSGDGTVAGDLKAAGHNSVAKMAVIWGKAFGFAEQINRRSTFIAAYRMAVDKNMADPAAFAEKAVNETQFVNNKGNKMKWGRGAIGATAMTFKSYSLNWLELMHRLATQNGPEGKLAAAYMLGALMLMSGAGGIPFAGDAEDLIDGLAQRLGYNFSSKKAKQQFLEDTFGKTAAGFIDKGITGIPGVPIDIAGRTGMGNLIPGTGLFLKKTDHTRDVMEFAGPAGDLITRGFTAADQLSSGEPLRAAETIAPKAVGNMIQGGRMATSGMYKDAKGYKVLDSSMGEAVGKAIGFQPSAVAQVQEANYLNQRAKDFHNMQKQAINAKWANGIFTSDKDEVQEARDMVKSWNENNPDQKITVNMPTILKRVREMRKDKAQRIADTAPKAMRAAMREDARRAEAVE